MIECDAMIHHHFDTQKVKEKLSMLFTTFIAKNKKKKKQKNKKLHYFTHMPTFSH
jgi:hypothetical protein